MAISDDVLTDMRAEDLDEIGPKIRDGDILLCAAHDPFSRLIGWSTKSPWSHVGIACRWPERGRILALECVEKIGVHAVSITRFITETSSGQTPYPGKIVLARHADLAERQDRTGDAGLDPMLNFAIDHMGDRFSGAEVIKIATRIAVGRLERHMPLSLGADNEFICSEYVARCFLAIGIQIAWDGLGFIAPADIAKDPKVEAVARFKTR